MRIVIRPSDIQLLLGIKYKSASNIICHLRTLLNKEKGQKITIKEFCNYQGISEDEAINKLKPYL